MQLMKPLNFFDMNQWVLDQKAKLAVAEKKRSAIHKKIEAATTPEEFIKLCSELTSIDLKIDALRARIKGKWGVTGPETFTMNTQ